MAKKATTKKKSTTRRKGATKRKSAKRGKPRMAGFDMKPMTVAKVVIGAVLGYTYADAPALAKQIEDPAMRAGALAAGGFFAATKIKSAEMRPILVGVAIGAGLKAVQVKFPDLTAKLPGLTGAKRIGRLSPERLQQVKRALNEWRGNGDALNGKLLGRRGAKLMGRKSTIMGGGAGDFDMFG